MIAKLAKGDVALSVSLTAVISLLGILTLPFLAAWSVTHFMGADAPEVNITSLAIKVFMITTLPVLIGVAIRHRATAFAMRIEPTLARIATVLFVIIIVAALASNWETFVATLSTLGPALIALNFSLLLLGLGLASLAGLVWTEAKPSPSKQAYKMQRLASPWPRSSLGNPMGSRTWHCRQPDMEY